MPGATSRERIARAFELCLTRPPTSQELARLEQLHRDQGRLSRTSSETGSFTALSQILLNLDEFMTRE